MKICKGCICGAGWDILYHIPNRFSKRNFVVSIIFIYMTVFAPNKKVGLNYEILERYQAGIELFGLEVKSVKHNLATLEGSHVTIRGGEAFLIGTTIPPYQPSNTAKDYEPTRNRKLLLLKKEIQTLANIEAKKGLTIVPISMYNSKGRIKVEIAVVRGKKKFDKREDIKKRDSDREIRRNLKNE
jgi:SsrA-binding protein